MDATEPNKLSQTEASESTTIRLDFKSQIAISYQTQPSLVRVWEKLNSREGLTSSLGRRGWGGEAKLTRISIKPPHILGVLKHSKLKIWSVNYLKKFWRIENLGYGRSFTFFIFNSQSKRTPARNLLPVAGKPFKHGGVGLSKVQTVEYSDVTSSDRQVLSFPSCALL